MAPSDTGGEASRQILEHGYAVFEDVFPQSEIDFFRERVAERYFNLGAPRTWANPPVYPAEDVEVTIVGLVFSKFGKHCPEVVNRVLTPQFIGLARDVLGAEAQLEYTAAVVNNGERPFFNWHQHIGGLDHPKIRHKGIYPTFERCERITALVYLDEINEASGPLLMLPRRITEPTHPIGDINQEPWPGQVALKLRRGSVVLIEQCTWHAARAKNQAGLRAFVASYWASGTTSSFIDDSLPPLAAGNPLLASVLPRKQLV